MTELMKRRFEIIKEVIDEYGLHLGKRRYISMWELADGINNRWNAHVFLSEKVIAGDKLFDIYGKQRSLKSHNKPKLFNGIRATIRACNYLGLIGETNSKAGYVEMERH